MAETTTGSQRSRAPRRTTEPAAPPEPEAPPRDHVCNVAFCPIGLALSTVQGAAPDVLEHLLKAAQEFLLAARAVVDNRAKDFEGEPTEGVLRRIEIS